MSKVEKLLVFTALIALLNAGLGAWDDWSDNEMRSAHDSFTRSLLISDQSHAITQ